MEGEKTSTAAEQYTPLVLYKQQETEQNTEVDTAENTVADTEEEEHVSDTDNSDTLRICKTINCCLFGVFGEGWCLDCFLYFRGV